MNDPIIQDEIKRIHCSSVQGEFESRVFHDILNTASLSGTPYHSMKSKEAIDNFWRDKLDK